MNPPPSHCVLPLILVFLLLLAAASYSCEAAITSCDQAVGYLKPCDEYLTGPTGAKPPSACCDGAKALVSAASTPEDRKTACECIKAAAQTIALNPQNAHDLPDNCGISLPFVISPDLDCNNFGFHHPSYGIAQNSMEFQCCPSLVDLTIAIAAISSSDLHRRDQDGETHNSETHDGDQPSSSSDDGREGEQRPTTTARTPATTTMTASSSTTAASSSTMTKATTSSDEKDDLKRRR